jgi:hypothetical protein
MTEDKLEGFKLIEQLKNTDAELAKQEKEIQLRRQSIQEEIVLAQVNDFGQLCWELYCEKTKNLGYQLYNDKKQFLEATYNIRSDGLEVCKYWARVVFFGIQNASVGLAAICELAKGYFCRLTFNKTFRWVKSEIDGHNRCQDGWQVFINPANEPYDGKFCENWLPPYEDERFDHRLELNFSNYSYSFNWVDGVYTFDAHCYSKESVEGFKKIFQEFPATVTGKDLNSGWKIVIPIYIRMPKLITHVAIIHEGKVYSLPAPNRHHHVIRHIVETTGARYVGGEQGFLDEAGKFLRRKPAKIRAEQTGQLKHLIDINEPLLFSEDLW